MDFDEILDIACTIIGLLLINFDFGSDIWVGVGLFNGCHHKFAAISFLFTTLPSILTFLFVIISSICTRDDDRMTNYVKSKSGLYPFHIIGLIMCFPLYTCVITIMKICNYGNLGEETTKGIQTLELLAESLPQLVFTCYIRANIGCGHGGWKNELIEGFDERIFSIVISTCTLTFGRATISATDFGREKMNFKIFKKLLGMLVHMHKN